MVLEGVQCDPKTESAGSHWLSVFSTHKRKGPRVSDSLKKFVNGDTVPTPLPYLSPSFVSPYFPSFALEIGPLNTAREFGGALYYAGSVAELSGKRIWCILAW